MERQTSMFKNHYNETFQESTPIKKSAPFVPEKKTKLAILEQEKKKPETKSQKQLVLDHIRHFGFITRIIARDKYGIMELSARIIDLQKEGHIFDITPVKIRKEDGQQIRVMEYRLRGGDIV